jgi:dCTP diphosphatase
VGGSYPRFGLDDSDDPVRPRRVRTLPHAYADDGDEVGSWSIQRLQITLACYLDLMADKSLHDEIQAFVAEREWAQFHSPANLAKSISIEAAELLECFQWNDDADRARVQEELADVLTYCLLLADRIGVDPDEIVREKLALTREKYPVDRARGRSAKYDSL